MDGRSRRMLAALLVITGCGGSPDAGSDRDSGARGGGARIDGGPAVDGGPGADGGSGVDGGPGNDAATLGDAGMLDDAAAPGDAGGIGPIVAAECGDTPIDFPRFVDCPTCVGEPNVSVCLDASGCRMTNDYRLSSPLQPHQCAVADRMFLHPDRRGRCGRERSR